MLIEKNSVEMIVVLYLSLITTKWWDNNTVF